jgi:hypothetical protein
MLIIGLVVYFTKFRKKPEVPKIVEDIEKYDLNETPPIEMTSQVCHFKPQNDYRYETKNIVYRD